jgi:predicted GTPase
MPELPFSTLSKFGSGFLSHFVGSITSAPLLEHVTLIDTPGVLSGEKQRIARSYDFSKAARWFADRSDLILLLVDAHKLDISDELKDVIEVVRPHNDDKIRCVLNKSDAVTREQLVRVYGSLLWNMGKIFSSPEVRSYIITNMPKTEH